jgi:hypothetical protein
VTDRGRPIAVLGPAASPRHDDGAMPMVRGGVAKWVGGKPRGSGRPATLRGKPVSDTVLEDRR